MEWWQKVEGWEMLSNRKVSMALGPLHIAQEPLQDLLGALNGLRVFFWHMCYVTCWRVLKQCCPHMYLEDDVSMKCQSGMAFHCLSPEVTQSVLPKNHSENQTSQRSECKLCFKTTLLGQTKALKTATAPRAGTSLAHLAFFERQIMAPFSSTPESLKGT